MERRARENIASCGGGGSGDGSSGSSEKYSVFGSGSSGSSGSSSGGGGGSSSSSSSSRLARRNFLFWVAGGNRGSQPGKAMSRRRAQPCHAAPPGFLSPIYRHTSSSSSTCKRHANSQFFCDRNPSEGQNRRTYLPLLRPVATH